MEIFNPFCFGRKKDACVPDNLENADLTIAFYIYNCIYLFGHAGSSLLCGLSSSCEEWGLLSSWDVRASHGIGFFCYGAQALRHVVFSCCGPQTLEH